MNSVFNSGLLGGNIKGDVQVVVSIDPGSAILTALLVLVAIVLASLALRVIK